MFAVLLASYALAGEMQIEGSPAVFSPRERVVEPSDAGLRSPPLAAGAHCLVARNGFGELLSAIVRTAGADARVVVGFSDGVIPTLGSIFASKCAASDPAVMASGVDLIQPLSEMKLLSFIAELRASGRASRQLEIPSAAVTASHITCSQLTRLIEPILFGTVRLEAVRTALPVVLDPDNSGLLAARFSFRGDQRQLRKIFE